MLGKCCWTGKEKHLVAARPWGEGDWARARADCGDGQPGRRRRAPADTDAIVPLWWQQKHLKLPGRLRHSKLPAVSPPQTAKSLTLLKLAVGDVQAGAIRRFWVFAECCDRHQLHHSSLRLPACSCARGLALQHSHKPSLSNTRNTRLPQHSCNHYNQSQPAHARPTCPLCRYGSSRAAAAAHCIAATAAAVALPTVLTGPPPWRTLVCTV